MEDRGWIAVPGEPAELVAGLFRTHYRRLVGLAALLSGDREAARDVVMDAFAGIYRSWGSLRDPDAAVAYLNRAVVNGSRNELRRGRLAVGRHLRLIPKLEDSPSAERDVLAHDDADQLRRALAQLSQRQREVLVLRYFLDQSEAEIAQTLGLSCGSVKTHASRGLAALARRLEDGR